MQVLWLCQGKPWCQCRRPKPGASNQVVHQTLSLTHEFSSPAVPEKVDVPSVFAVSITWQSPLYPTPQAFQVPLNVDVILEDECTLVPSLDHSLDRSRVTPEGRDHTFVHLSPVNLFPRVPQYLRHVEVGVTWSQVFVRARLVRLLENGDPRLFARGDARERVPRKYCCRLVVVGSRGLHQPVIANGQSTNRFLCNPLRFGLNVETG